MYLTLDVIKTSLDNLRAFHPFFGQTFLVFKKGSLPIAQVIDFQIDKMEKRFLEQYYKPFDDVEEYYRVMRGGVKKDWNGTKYTSSGSQSTRTRGNFAKTLIHEPKSSLWGWDKNYVKILQDLLPDKRPVPVFYLAVWLYRKLDWSIEITPQEIVAKFATEFKLTRFETPLFNREIPDLNFDIFQEEPVTETELKLIIKLPENSIDNFLKDNSDKVLSFLEQKSTLDNSQFEIITDAQLLSVQSLLNLNSDSTDALRLILNSILYVLRTGCDWEEIPVDQPKPDVCQQIYFNWLENGTWKLIWNTVFDEFEADTKLAWLHAFLQGNIIPIKN